MELIPFSIKELLNDFDLTTNKLFSFSTGLNRSYTKSAPLIKCFSPIDGGQIFEIPEATDLEYDHVLGSASSSFEQWRKVPAPHRGEFIRHLGNEFRAHKELLANLISLENGKIYQESLGEVQEVIDICDFAVGLSRQLHGLTIVSERTSHRMMEQYHPLGVVGIISAFNFPVAVWAWNAVIACVCGDTSVWKPSEKTPLIALATFQIVKKAMMKYSVPQGVMNLIIGNAFIGKKLAQDPRVALLSATGSTSMGKAVALETAQRLGKSILELGGNNAVIVTPTANIEMALQAVVFGAVGTCGQRCTSTRRVIIHVDVYDIFVKRLLEIYPSITIGSPLDPKTLVGPLIDELAVKNYLEAIESIKQQGGKIIFGGALIENISKGYFVLPTLAEVENHYPIVQKETFAPILYLIKYQESILEAIHLQNSVKQGLSSSIFTNKLQEAEIFLSAQGSDCGIANVNLGTSGAEIGGAFGGEKETGGGRESGSDAWKGYMRRQTNTINYGLEMPLAQGINFNLKK